VSEGASVTLLLPLLATFMLLVASSVLVATVGRHRRRRGDALEQRAVAAIEAAAGASLAELAGEGHRLRRLLEDTAGIGREMLAIEAHLGGPLRRPLWRQIEDANFGHQIDRIRRDATSWLGRFDGLDAADRQIVEQLNLEVGPVRALLESERFHWRDDGPPFEALRDRSEELARVQHQLEAAITCLRHIERELSDYRSAGYR
jgi:hypothetical protein